MRDCAALNRIYRVIWNRARGVWMVVGELATGMGKSSGRRRLSLKGLLLLIPLALFSPLAVAAPTGGQVTAGSGTISQSGSTTTINQASQNLSLSWKTFNVASTETVNFDQPNSSAVAVNRISDPNGSQIMGHLNANGNVYLINPNGILFGPSAQVNVGGLVASTLNIGDASLSSSNQSFSGSGTGSIVNKGTINASHYVALLGDSVTNSGVITAQLGTVAMGAGNDVSLTFSGNNLLKLQVNQSVLNTLVANHGLIQANGGTVIMNAGAQDSLLASVVNNDGIVEAQTVSNHNGTISLLGGRVSGTVNVGGTLDASAPNGGNGGSIETSAHTVNVADNATITTAASMGLNGSWLLDPYDFTVGTNSTNGNITGTNLGTALGNSSVTIQTVTTPASATGTNTLGTNNSGSTNGDIYINAAVSWNAATTLTLDAYRNIYINKAITSSNASGKMVLDYGQGSANGVIGGVTASYSFGLSSTGFAGQINLQAGSNFSTKLGSSGTVTNFKVVDSISALQAINSNSTTKAGDYVLGANLNDSNKAFTPIGAVNGSSYNSNTGTFTYTTNAFVGKFDGLGHTISNLNVSGANNVGLFGYIGINASNGAGVWYQSPGVVRNVGVVGGSISGTGSNIGGLVGDMRYGTISDCYSTGTVSGAGYVGGLVGENEYYGIINNSYATGSVTGTSGGYGDIGGLVGYNTNAISNSYATGAVNVSVGKGGGLVGTNSLHGTIKDSYATGNVTGTSTASSNVIVGGLVGEVSDTIARVDVSNSYATGNVTVTGTSNAGNMAGGLVGSNAAGTINTAYATGKVSSSAGGKLGGLVGKISNYVSTNTTYGTVNNSFWDTTTTGMSAAAGSNAGGHINGGGGLTTTNMQQQASFTPSGTAAGDWDFTNIWTIYNGHTDPLLRAFMTPLTVTANSVSTTYNGSTYSGGYSVSYSVTPNASLTGTVSYGGTSKTAVNAGTNYTIIPSGLTSYSQQGYIITYVNGTLTINPKTLTVVGESASNKTYDGTTSATLSGGTLSGVIAADTSNVSLTESGSFNQSNVGTNLPVTASDSLSGSASGNYTLTQPTGLTANIAKANLTLSGSQVYNGGTAFAGSNLTATGVNGETFSVTGSGATGNLSSANVQTGSTLASVTGLSLGSSTNGGLVGNYNVIGTTGSSVNITPAPLTVTGESALNKTYDGTTAATLSGGSLNGVIGTDNVTLSQSGSFAQSNVGTNIAVTAADTLGGTAAGNYTLTQPTGLTADITKAPLTVTANNASKTYDGLAWSGGNGVSYSGFVNGETASVLGGTLAYGGTSQGAKNAGSYVITPSGLTSGNYAITFANGTLTINPAPLTLTGITASNKVYDGTTAATLNTGSVGYSGLVAGDSVSLSGSGVGTFSDKNVGTGKVVTVSGYTLSGPDAGNYMLAQPVGLTANISAASLTITADNASKVYDGKPYSGGNGVSYNGFVSGDNSSVLGGILAYGGSSQGAVKIGNYVITPSGLTASNYTISFVNGVLTIEPGTAPQNTVNVRTTDQSLANQTPPPQHGQVVVQNGSSSGNGSEGRGEGNFNGLGQNSQGQGGASSTTLFLKIEGNGIRLPKGMLGS